MYFGNAHLMHTINATYIVGGSDTIMFVLSIAILWESLTNLWAKWAYVGAFVGEETFVGIPNMQEITENSSFDVNSKKSKSCRSGSLTASLRVES